MIAVEVVILAEALDELAALPAAERQAVARAIGKLEVGGDQLGFPHTSAIQGAASTLREVRPRAGRSRWRAFYRRVRDQLVIGAIGPEAGVDPGRFRRATALAASRIDEYETSRRP
jgi:phage-related protein